MGPTHIICSISTLTPCAVFSRDDTQRTPLVHCPTLNEAPPSQGPLHPRRLAPASRPTNRRYARRVSAGSGGVSGLKSPREGGRGEANRDND
eukprot:5170041-Pyramimonas_sp.AAC.1